MTAVIAPETQDVSGSRAHKLLANLDAAKRQKVQNEKMRNLVLDCEEVLNKLHQQTYSQKQRMEVERVHQRSADLLKELEGSLSYTHLRKFNVSKYMADCAQEMQVRDLMRYEDQPVVEPIHDVSKALEALKGKGPNAPAFESVIIHSLQILGKVVTLLEDSKLKAKAWATICDPVLALLRDVINQPHPGDCLQELDEQCKRLLFNIEEVTNAQQDAIERGEMSEMESLYYKKITVQEALADVITSKFEVLDSEAKVSFQQPLQRVHEVHNKANAEISVLLREKEELKKRCEADLANLNAEVERVNLDDYNATKAHANLMEKSDCVMKENMLQQDLCWRKIEALEKELISLGNTRSEEIKRRIKQLEHEEKRKVEYQHFTEFAAQHKRLLELTIHNCEIAEEVTDCIDELVSAQCNAIERHMRHTEKVIEDIRVGIHESYLEHFRSMYLTIGDLTYKKEANIQALEEKIQVAHMQQEMLMESLNPKAKEYSQMKKDLSKVKEELANQVSTLKEKSTLYIESFRPTEQALIEAGKEFLHPVDQLNEMNEARKSKLIAYHQLVAGEADSTGDLEQERQQIDQLRITCKSETRRGNGSSPTVHA